MIASVDELQALAEQYRRFEERQQQIRLGNKLLIDLRLHKREEESLNVVERKAVVRALDAHILLLNAGLLVCPK
jgi:hypothetical protein